MLLETKKIAIAVLIILVLGAGGYYFYTKNNGQSGYPFGHEVVPTITPPTSNRSDSDKDGLSDTIEKVLGTNINNADTDGDAYSDLDEIKNGYDPLVAGSTKLSAEEWQALKGKIKTADKEFYEKNFAIEKEPIIDKPDFLNLTGSPTPSQTDTSFVCGTSTVKDIDNNIYNTVKIGEQCWLKENLKVTKNPAGEAITRYCYDNDPKICETDGGLYDWNTTMNNSTIEGSQGICPNGWYVPKDSELYTLENYLTDSKIKDADPQTIISDDDGCIYDRGGKGCYSAAPKFLVGGSSGFDAILTGNRTLKGLFSYRGDSADFWSSSEKNKDNAWLRQLNRDFSWVIRSYDVKSFGFLVRCLKD